MTISIRGVILYGIIMNRTYDQTINDLHQLKVPCGRLGDFAKHYAWYKCWLNTGQASNVVLALRPQFEEITTRLRALGRV